MKTPTYAPQHGYRAIDAYGQQCRASAFRTISGSLAMTWM
jgi:hypothetical protein